MKPHYTLVDGKPVLDQTPRPVTDEDLEKFREAWQLAKTKLEAKWANQRKCNALAQKDRYKVIGQTGCNLAGRYIAI